MSHRVLSSPFQFNVARELKARNCASSHGITRPPTARAMAASDHYIQMSLQALRPIEDQLESLSTVPPKTVLKKCIAILEEHDLVYKLRIPPEQLCVHYLNRYGSGLNPYEVHRWIKNVLAQGFDSDVIAGRPTATEMPPKIDLKIRGRNVIDLNEELASFNAKLVEKSDGLLAPCGDQKYNTLCAGHTNGGLKAFKTGARAAESTMTWAGPDGCLSMQLLKSTSEEMHQSAMTGLEWRVIR